MTETGMSGQYTKDCQRPNVHVGLHYSAVVEEYGLASLVNVLGGEDKHKSVRKLQTHHGK